MFNPNEASPLERKFTPTSLEELICPRYYYYRKLLPYINSSNPTAKLSQTSNISALFGQSIHAGVAEYYKLKQLKLTKELMDEIKCKVIFAFLNVWETSNISTSTYNSSAGIRILSSYCENYNVDIMVFKPELIECQQWIEMPNNTMLGVIMDRITASGYTALIDTKTSSRPLTDYFFKKFESSFQFSAYYYVMQEMFGHCDLITCDAIHIPKPGVKSTEAFVRKAFFRTTKQMKEWLNTYINRTNFVNKGVELSNEDDREKYFYQETQKCMEFGVCRYWKICSQSEEI